MQPNILLIIADDHAPAAFSAYGSRINGTPNLDRIAQEGARLDNCFCTNALCTPARATIMTGAYSHVNGVKTLPDQIDQSRHVTLPMLLHDAGYQTAFLGKWHLGLGPQSAPAGCDYWAALPGQGAYFDPELVEMGARRTFPGYVTDVLTDLSLAWLEQRDPARPFFLVCAHKAPHDPFIPHPRDLARYTEPIPEPRTFRDDYRNRAAAATMTTQRVALMHTKNHLPEPVPQGLSEREQAAWNYQCFMRNYLRCVAAIDDNVGRMLAYLDDARLTEDTIVVYTADHGFFLGEHGWYDKRFMYEPSIRIPFLMRYPRAVAPGTESAGMALNVDFAPTLLDYAGVPTPEAMQGRSLRPLVQGDAAVANWRTSFYYRYWMHRAHFDVPAHYGVRTERYKLIYYYGEALGSTGALDAPTPPEWELFDLATDPDEMRNLYGDPAYAGVVAELTQELRRLRAEVGDRE